MIAQTSCESFVDDRVLAYTQDGETLVCVERGVIPVTVIKVSERGQLALPPGLRSKYGLLKGDRFLVRDVEGGIVLERLPSSARHIGGHGAASGSAGLGCRSPTVDYRYSTVSISNGSCISRYSLRCEDLSFSSNHNTSCVLGLSLEYTIASMTEGAPWQGLATRL